MKKLIGMLFLVVVALFATGCSALRVMGQSEVEKEKKTDTELKGKYGEFPKLWETIEVFLAVGKEQAYGPCEYILVWRRLDEVGKVHVGRTESSIFAYGQNEPGLYLAMIGEEGYWLRPSELKY